MTAAIPDQGAGIPPRGRLAHLACMVDSSRLYDPCKEPIDRLLARMIGAIVQMRDVFDGYSPCPDDQHDYTLGEMRLRQIVGELKHRHQNELPGMALNGLQGKAGCRRNGFSLENRSRTGDRIPMPAARSPAEIDPTDPEATQTGRCLAALRAHGAVMDISAACAATGLERLAASLALAELANRKLAVRVGRGKYALSDRIAHPAQVP